MTSPRVSFGLLLDRLRAAGLPIGPDDFVRVGRLVERDNDWTQAQLRLALRVLLAKSPSEIELFDRVWSQTVALQAPLTPTPTAPVRQRRRWAVPAVASLLVAATVVAIVVVTQSEKVPFEFPLPVHVQEPPPQPEATSDRPRAVQRDAPSTLNYVRPLPPPETESITSPVPAPRWWAWAVLLLVAALAGLILGVRRRRRLHSQASPQQGPWDYVERPPDRPPPFDERHLEDVAARLEAPNSRVRGQQIDVNRTVKASAARAGAPTLRWRPASVGGSIAVLYEPTAGADAVRTIYDPLLAALRRRGLRLDAYDLLGPDRCVRPRGSTASLSFASLAEISPSVLVVGDGATSWDATNRRVRSWVSWLDAFAHLVWLNPIPRPRRSAAARALAQRLPMVHGASAGLAGDVITGLGPFPPRVARAATPQDRARALRQHLGPQRFELLCRCALAGPPSANALHTLADRFHPDLSPDDRLAVLTLDWFGDGEWPDGLRETLEASLSTEAAAATRRSLLVSLDESAPKTNSLAHLQWRLRRARHGAALGQAEGCAELSALQATAVHREALQASRGLGLRPEGAAWTAALFAIVLLALGSAAIGAAAELWRARRPALQTLRIISPEEVLVRERDAAPDRHPSPRIVTWSSVDKAPRQRTLTQGDRVTLGGPIRVRELTADGQTHVREIDDVDSPNGWRISQFLPPGWVLISPAPPQPGEPTPADVYLPESFFHYEACDAASALATVQDLLSHVSDFLNPAEGILPTARLWELAGNALSSPSGLGASARWGLAVKDRTLPIQILGVRLVLFQTGVGFAAVTIRSQSDELDGWLDLLHYGRFAAGQRGVTLRAFRRVGRDQEEAFFPAMARGDQTTLAIFRGLLDTVGLAEDGAVREVFVPGQLMPFGALFVRGGEADERARVRYRVHNYFHAQREIAPSAADLADDAPGLLAYAADQCFVSSLEGAIFVGFDVPDTEFFQTTLPHHIRDSYFLLFLLALHQRFALMALSDAVTRHWVHGSTAEREAAFERLRARLLDFAARGHFGQVSQRHHHHRSYRHWCDDFEVDRLYAEVVGEVREINDYLLLERTRRLQALAETQRVQMAEQALADAEREAAARLRAQRLQVLGAFVGFPVMIASLLRLNIAGIPSPLPWWLAFGGPLLGGGLIGLCALWVINRRR